MGLSFKMKKYFFLVLLTSFFSLVSPIKTFSSPLNSGQSTALINLNKDMKSLLNFYENLQDKIAQMNKRSNDIYDLQEKIDNALNNRFQNHNAEKLRDFIVATKIIENDILSLEQEIRTLELNYKVGLLNYFVEKPLISRNLSATMKTLGPEFYTFETNLQAILRKRENLLRDLIFRSAKVSNYEKALTYTELALKTSPELIFYDGLKLIFKQRKSQSQYQKAYTDDIKKGIVNISNRIKRHANESYIPPFESFTYELLDEREAEVSHMLRTLLCVSKGQCSLNV